MPSAASTQRYIRRNIHKNSFDVFVACLPVLENDTLTEIHDLIPRLMPNPTKGGVTVHATLPEIYGMNLGLRTANRILLRLSSFPAWSFPMLFGNARRVFWPAFVANPSHLEIRVSSRMSRLNMKERVASTIRAAIESRFGALSGDSSCGLSTLYVRIVENSVTLSLDTTGEHLHKRGDKPMTDVAPLRSTMASYALKRALSREPSFLCDPFCGSGTILMEAARISDGLAPGAHRTFAFMDHPYFRPGSWRRAQRDYEEQRKPLPSIELHGGDVSKTAVRSTQANLRLIGGPQAESAKTGVRDFHASLSSLPGPGGVVVTNPPYGVRLGGRAEARTLQRDFAQRLGAHPTRLDFWVFTPFPEVFKSDAIDIRKVTPINTGGIKISLVQGHAGQRE